MHLTTTKRRLIATILIFFALAFTVQFLAPPLVERAMIRTIEKNCQSCELSIRDTSISLLPLSISFSKFKARVGNNLATGATFKIETLSARISYLPLLIGRLSLHDVQVVKPDVVVTEGDLRSSDLPENQAESQGAPTRPTAAPLRAFVELITITGGKFTYIREFPRRPNFPATLRITDLNGTLQDILAKRKPHDGESKAKISGLLEGTGEFTLTLLSSLFAEAFNMDVDLVIQGQKLTELSEFFKRNSGIKMEGLLVKGHGALHVRGQELNGSVLAQYKGLDIKLLKTRERSSTSAMFSNLFGALIMSRSDMDDTRAEQTRTVKLVQEREETRLQLILRGLSSGALRVATND